MPSSTPRHRAPLSPHLPLSLLLLLLPLLLLLLPAPSLGAVVCPKGYAGQERWLSLSAWSKGCAGCENGDCCAPSTSKGQVQVCAKTGDASNVNGCPSVGAAANAGAFRQTSAALSGGWTARPANTAGWNVLDVGRGDAAKTRGDDTARMPSFQGLVSGSAATGRKLKNFNVYSRYGGIKDPNDLANYIKGIKEGHVVVISIFGDGLIRNSRDKFFDMLQRLVGVSNWYYGNTITTARTLSVRKGGERKREHR